ncbi:light-regulated protein 1, chloroplastic [Juglans microcarpa x Juglans regia]|uniref:light-regulated protein 1, chloroplastic n=1 Tax=Juglans microcarpa x Juglans regia TaxID=2249226 RepID=UPI001B7F0393|nr:light-regulated protein 1, chloroplastic [Juglans microcarpa x Juglans regia]
MTLTFHTHYFKMQAALTFAPTLLPLTPSKNFSLPTSFPPKTSSLGARFAPIKATPAANANDTTTVDYSSINSVFPAEACETIGGEACLADIYPEVRLQPEATNRTARIGSEDVDREYLEYTDAKTVFQGEACDDLGGIFCEHEYQKGVY